MKLTPTFAAFRCVHVKKITRFLIFIVFSSASFCSLAQSAIENTQVWMDGNYYKSITPDFRIGGTLGLKTNADFANRHILHIRPRVFYDISDKITVHAGIGWFENLYSESVSSSEVRLEQQIFFPSLRDNKLKLDHRIRAEERYFHYHNLDGINFKPEWKGRLRYRIRLKSKNFTLLNSINNFSVSLAGESFVPVDKNGFTVKTIEEQIYFGFGQSLPKGHKYEVNILWQGKIKPDKASGTAGFWALRLRYFLSHNKKGAK